MMESGNILLAAALITLTTFTYPSDKHHRADGRMVKYIQSIIYCMCRT